jgi:hypothetical protein
MHLLPVTKRQNTMTQILRTKHTRSFSHIHKRVKQRVVHHCKLLLVTLRIIRPHVIELTKGVTYTFFAELAIKFIIHL